MKKVFTNNPIFRIVAPPLYGTIIYLLILMINNSLATLDETFFTEEVYLSIGLTYLVFEANGFLIKRIEKMSFVVKSFISKIVLILTSNLIITLLLVSIIISAYFAYVLGFSTYSAELTYFNIIFLISSLLYNVIYISNLFLFRENEERIEEETALRENIEREYHEFKNDINPELLYENLESLMTLVHKSPVAAEDFIDRLSLAYRYILSNKQNEMVALVEELKAAENILSLLNVKYEQNISLEKQLEAEDQN